ncbi:Nucleotide-binding oligomerization domain-containing protein 1, partial [Hondaea fermentalgiana]
HEGATALANALAKHKSLHTLSLQYNDIGDEGATSLAGALAKNDLLHTLEFHARMDCDGWNPSRDFVHLGVSCNVERSLRNNNIGDKGATALANALVKVEALQKLK